MLVLGASDRSNIRRTLAITATISRPSNPHSLQEGIASQHVLV